MDSDLVNKAIIKQCFERKNVVNVCFANAILPLRGDDAQYISLVESEWVTAPNVDNYGVADMLSTHQFQLVEIGTHLMKRVPPTEGETGIDVVGEEIKAEQGNDPGYLNDMTGVCFSPEDGNILISNIKAHPVFLDSGVNVDSTMHVENVDLNTGNITFDGSLEVSGDVDPGMFIEVTGDVFIKGSILFTIILGVFRNITWP
ncbi:MAG: FapA family protein [Pseudomonadales bacterium]|nr:FapA family protein [Pseudomonadales bacterium]